MRRKRIVEEVSNFYRTVAFSRYYMSMLSAANRSSNSTIHARPGNESDRSGRPANIVFAIGQLVRRADEEVVS